MTIRRTAIWTIAGVAALLLISCGGGAPEATVEAETPISATETLSAATASPAPISEATDEPTAVVPATSPPIGSDAQMEISGFEQIALNAGLSTYSGHSCLYTPVGCACELPELVQSQFEYDDTADELVFTLVGDGYQTVWHMTHIGVNKWIRSEPIVSAANGEQTGEARVLVSFDEEGYIMTYLFDDFNAGIVTCPDVPFTRVGG